MREARNDKYECRRDFDKLFQMNLNNILLSICNLYIIYIVMIYVLNVFICSSSDGKISKMRDGQEIKNLKHIEIYRFIILQW